jgi:hypothetical protein
MRNDLETLAPPAIAGNMVSRKAMNRAIQEGVAAACPDETMQNRVGGALSHMTPEALGSDLLNDIAERRDALELAHDIGFINAAIITLPNLKTTTGKGVATYNTPTNTQIVREVTRKLLNPDRNLEVTVALGGSEQAPSLRLPTYIQPALDIAAIFVSRDRQPPTLRIVNAFQISSTLNGLDPQLAEHRATQAEQLMGAYIDTFHQELVPHVRMERLTFEEVAAKTEAIDAEMLESIMNADSESLNPEESIAQQALLRLRRAAAKHYQGGDQEVDAIICGYAATHGLAFHNYGYPDVDGVIKIGGRGEAPFDVIQQFMASAYAKLGQMPVANRTSRGTTQLTSLRSVAGTIPPYYPETSQTTGMIEPTVDSTVEDIPNSHAELVDMYASNGLLSGVDLAQLPSHIALDYAQFLRRFLGTRLESGEAT